MKNISSLLYCLLLCVSSFATVITVSNTNDSGAGSLREAVQNANPGDTIRFNPALVSSSNAVINLSSEIVITEPITIIGETNGSFFTEVNGQNNTRLFRVNISTAPKNLIIDKLSLQAGQPPSSGQLGGAIRLQSFDTLRLLNSEILNCQAAYGGAIGGAIYSWPYEDAIIIENCTINSNTATAQGGAIYMVGDFGGVFISDSKFQNNDASGDGGVIYFDNDENSDLLISNCSFIGNDATGDGGAVFAQVSSANCNLIITDSTVFENNSAGNNRSGGAIFFGYSFGTSSGTTLIVNNGSRFENNDADDDGGAIYFLAGASGFLSLKNCEFSFNSGTDGGAVHLNGGTLDTIYNVKFISNTASDEGGAFYQYYAHVGGSNIPFITTNSVFDGNHANNSGGGIWSTERFWAKKTRFISNSAGQNGGAFANELFIGGSWIDSCTFSNNSAGNNGGALFHDLNTTAYFPYELDSLTVNGNSAGNDGGFLFIDLLHPTVNLNMNRCLFDSNSANGNGGGVFVYNQNDGVNLNLDSSSFTNNHSNGMGGVFSFDIEEYDMKLNHSWFDQNTADSVGGVFALLKHAGGQNINDIRIDTSIIQDCSSNIHGGAFYVSGREDSRIIFNATEIRNCHSAENGGAIFHYSNKLARTYLENSTVFGNSATMNGGAVYSEVPYNFNDAQAIIYSNQSTITENSAGMNGGGFYVLSSKGGSFALIENSSLINNVATDTGSSVYSKITGVGYSEIECTSSIIISESNSNLYNSKPLTVESYGYNIFSDSPLGAAPNSFATVSDFLNVDSTMLPFGPLQLNGGLTRTLLPLPGNLAINQGNPNDAIDAQNGPLTLTRDIGAAESGSCASYTYPVVSECDSYTWSANNQNYTNSGVYFDTLTNGNSCDSVVTLNLTIRNSSSYSENVSTCDSYFWNATGQTYFQSDTLQTILVNSEGCDSVTNLTLTIRYSSEGNDTIEACGSYTWPATGQTFTSSTTETLNTANSQGCDSTSTLHLTIHPAAIAQFADSAGFLEAFPGMESYQWIDCENNQALIGDTSRFFSPSQNGSYAVVVSNGFCSDTSECRNIGNVGLNEFSESSISIYPNPTDGLVTVALPEKSAARSISLYSYSGQLIWIKNTSNENQLKFELPSQAGLYFIRLESASGQSQTFRLTKN